MKTVRIVGGDVTYPNKCACCLQPPAGTLEVRKEDLKRLAAAAVASAAIRAAGGASSLGGKLRSSRAVQVPYCSSCLKHIKWNRLGAWLGVGLSALVNAFFGAMGGLLLYTMLSIAAEDEKSGPKPELVIGACVAIGIAIALSQVRLRPGHLDRSHAASGKDAVEIASFAGDAMSLRCHNNTFAGELVQANPGAVGA